VENLYLDGKACKWGKITKEGVRESIGRAWEEDAAKEGTVVVLCEETEGQAGLGKDHPP